MSRILDPGKSRLFGTQRRTEVLTATALLGESYPRELARVLNAPLFSVQRAVDALEVEGVIAGRLIGRERRVTLNPRYFAINELKPLLARLAQVDGQLRSAAESLRRRPRKRGKAI